jgi:hypothetical protein
MWGICRCRRQNKTSKERRGAGALHSEGDEPAGAGPCLGPHALPAQVEDAIPTA